MSKYRGEECAHCGYEAPDSNHPSGLTHIDGQLVCGDCKHFYWETGSWPDEQSTLSFGEDNGSEVGR